jgi:hypothetical protein
MLLPRHKNGVEDKQKFILVLPPELMVEDCHLRLTVEI